LCGGMQIYVSKDGQRYCLYSSNQLREYVQQGNFTLPTTLVLTDRTG
jgi:hypothetical protein